MMIAFKPDATVTAAWTILSTSTIDQFYGNVKLPDSLGVGTIKNKIDLLGFCHVSVVGE